MDLAGTTPRLCLHLLVFLLCCQRQIAGQESKPRIVSFGGRWRTRADVMTGRIQSSSQRCYFGEKNWEMLSVCCQWGAIVKVCGSLSVQEQEFPCEMSGKQQEGDGAGPGGSLSPLCLENCGEKGSWKENRGNLKLSRTKDDHKGWFVFTFSLTEKCKTELIIPPHPSNSQNLAEWGHIWKVLPLV